MMVLCTLRPAILLDFLTPLAGDADPFVRARAENVLFERRLTAARLDAYRKRWNGGGYEGWCECHADYLADAIRVDLPETFLPINRLAALPAEVTSERGELQTLVRVEPLAPALEAMLLGDVATVHEKLLAWKAGGEDAGLAKSYLEKLCTRLSQHRKAVGPRFAAFEGDVAADAADDAGWAEQLRNRLGLSHYPWPDFPEPFPVILMRYPLKDVLEALPGGAAHPLAVPTQLDQDLNEVFHPSPPAENYGRTLNLAGDPECERMTAEVLHLPIPYVPRHIWKVGIITSRVDISPERVAQLRENHLFCLRFYGDPDFGKL